MNIINQVQCSHQDLFALTFKAYELNAVRSMGLQRQTKFFPYEPRSQLIGALLYTYAKTFPSNTSDVVFCVRTLPVARLCTDCLLANQIAIFFPYFSRDTIMQGYNVKS